MDLVGTKLKSGEGEDGIERKREGSWSWKEKVGGVQERIWRRRKKNWSGVDWIQTHYIHGWILNYLKIIFLFLRTCHVHYSSQCKNKEYEWRVVYHILQESTAFKGGLLHFLQSIHFESLQPSQYQACSLLRIWEVDNIPLITWSLICHDQ